MENSNITKDKVFSIKVGKERTEDNYRKYIILDTLKNLVICEDIGSGTRESFTYWDLEKNAVWEN